MLTRLTRLSATNTSLRGPGRQAGPGVAASRQR
jgi:hypothetical protein